MFVPDAARRQSGRRGPLYGLVAAYLVSGLGTAMSAVAIPWLVLVSTGSPATTGVIAFAQMAPYVTMQATAGPLVDRVGLRRTFLLGNSAAALVMGAIPTLHLAGKLNLATLAALVAAAGTVRGLADCATIPLVTPTAHLAQVPFERAAGLHSAANRTAMLVGMPLSGALIAAVGAANVVLVDAVSFAAGVAVLAVFVPPTVGQPQEPAEKLGLRTYTTELVEGLRFLRGDRLLLGIAAMVAVTNLLDEALAAVLLPVWVHDRLHQPQALGLIGGTLGAGMLGGVLAGAWLGPRLPRRLTYAFGFLIGGSPPFFALAAWGSLTPVLPLCLIAGLAGGVLNPILGAAQLERIPPHLQARVLGATKASAWLGVPVGPLLGGVLTENLGLTATLLLCGTAMLITTLAPFTLPAWHGLERPPAPAPTPHQTAP